MWAGGAGDQTTDFSDNRRPAPATARESQPPSTWDVVISNISGVCGVYS